MENDHRKIDLEILIPAEHAGRRLDQSLATLFPEYSRQRLKEWIISGDCLVNGKQWQPKTKVSGGEMVKIIAELAVVTAWQPEKPEPDQSVEKLDIVYEDEQLLVVNKPANCVVHPGNGNATNTLVNVLLAHIPTLANVPRAGIVHRLDKDTTGLMVVAKTIQAHYALVSQLQQRTVKRTYEAIVNGVLISGGTVDQPLARDPRNRLKMAVVTNGKTAITYYRVLTRFRGHTHIRLQLETGRTHQIRVHMAYIKHNLLGDQTYGGRLALPKQASQELIMAIRSFPRQALHATALQLQHPTTQELMQWEIPLSNDLQQLLTILQQDQTMNEPS